jgi:hypothetical protein
MGSLEKYDEDLLKTGRLIASGLYVNIILKDYERTVLNLNRSGPKWDLEPRLREKKNSLTSDHAPEATRKPISIEFNLICR